MSARFTTALALLLLTGCSATAPVTIQMPVQKSKLDADLEKKSSALHHYLLGELSIKKDDLPGAIKNFNRASELTTKPSAQLSGALAELELRAGNLDKALEESTKALEASPQDARVLALHAGILDAEGQTAEAVEYYRKALTESPDSPEYAILLSSLLIKIDRSSEAISELRGFLKKHPNEPLVQFFLGRTYEQKGDLKSAALYMKMARDAQKDNVNLAIEYVRVLLKQHRANDAKAVCTEILKKDPENKLVRKVMAQLLIGENKLEEALQHFEVLEKIEEDSTESQMSIALIQLERKNYDDAIRELNLVLAKNADNTDALYALANAHAGKGNIDEAASKLMEIPSGDKNFERSRTYAAFLYRQAGKLAEAEEALKDVISENKPEAATVMYLAEIYKQQGKLEEARETLADLIETDKDNDRLLYEYALVCYRLNDRTATLQTMSRILEINPKNPDALNFLAYDLAESGGDLHKALEMAQKALEMKPNDGYALDTLGWIQFKMGNIKDASATLRRAVSIVNDDPVVLEHYGDVLMAEGKPSEAIEVYKSIDPAKAVDEDGKKSVLRVQEKIRKQ